MSARFYFSGPKLFSGDLGKAIQGTVVERPVGPFDRISCPDFPVLSNETVMDINSDSQYLYKLCRAVIDGK